MKLLCKPWAKLHPEYPWELITWDYGDAVAMITEGTSPR